MRQQRFYYLINVQYLGFRFSGWQKQPGQKTIEGMITKTLKFIMPNVQFKILGAGRTDSKVSALDAAFELFINDVPIKDHAVFLELFNENLPSDIRVTGIKQVDESFNIIKDPKTKEYIYLFSFGSKNHPFSAPFITNILENLDLQAMVKATSFFVGSHDFTSYTVKAQKNKQRLRTIDVCEIRENTLFKANFFPEKSYALHIKGKGFMRYQIRMIMGALIQLGKGELSLNDIEDSLSTPGSLKLTTVAPGSGLLLNSIEFK
ncbi:tRNA pseudouridine(38-40) synthase TruA [Maribacter polysiphoniae]|uniref:tRNA pseudouridine synthase A n=1 Tax=Maribacter polysiphoniae TaxID=429344 RepID=A0A316DVS0_9FLAO|nr:tRNA pseudouridine(38-40) synthase TruA [Maribacter polysiphoniae]MBD1262457.1 tRNA pseudouridine(38-40) synthase TruA [Maribacter polysiphoniae]PWK21289.1 tRNA pseudouridine38-40 synthase [Maribacter polysiphoniae]